MQVPARFITTKADTLAIEQGCYWDAEQAERPVRFAEQYFRPQFIEGKFTLLPWQADWLRQLYGWRLADGRRRWRKALLTVAKKNGKNLLGSIVALYEALAAGVPSPLVVSASTTRENARQIYDEVRHTIQAHPRLKALAKLAPSLKLARFPSRNAEFRSISNDSGNAEGLNLSACICDEVHAWKGEQLFRTLEYASIARPDGILLVISTAGHDQGHWWYDLVAKARNIIKGEDLDTSMMATVFEADIGDDIDSPATWAKANPSMGTSFTEADFRRDLDAAKSDTSSLLSFRRYRLNQWVQADDAYMNPDLWDTCRGTITEEQLRQAPLYVGADLSQTTDPCSISMVWALSDRRFFVRSHAWVCREGVARREQQNLPRYQQFQADGNLTITPGTCNDYRAIRAYLLGLRQRYQLREIVFDQWNSLEMAAELQADGITVFRFPQNHRHYTPACKELEVAVKEQRLQHDGNRLLRWALSNTRMDTNAYGDVKPSRDKSTDKIDPAVSTLMAFSRAVQDSTASRPRPSVYDQPGRLLLF